MNPVRFFTRLFSKAFFPIGVYAEVAILEQFIMRPNERHYVMDIITKTKVLSGNCYVLLARLEHWRWVESGVEILTGRRWYYLTDLGMKRAWQAYPNMFTSLDPEILGGAR